MATIKVIKTVTVVKVISVGLQGPRGERGQIGETGEKGEIGETGEPGFNGILGGTDSPNGNVSATGRAIYLQDTGQTKPVMWFKKTAGTSDNEWV